LSTLSILSLLLEIEVEVDKSDLLLMELQDEWMEAIADRL